MTPLLTLAALVALGALALYAVRKLRHLVRAVARLESAVARLSHGRAPLREMHRADIDDAFRQLEALHALHLDLGMPLSLPPTRGRAGSPDFLAVLARHALAAKPGVIVECGSGVTTVVLARCAEISGAGHVYSLEHLPRYAARTRTELDRHGLSAWASVVDAPLEALALGGRQWRWYALDGLPDAAIDMLVVDGPPVDVGDDARYPAGPRLFGRLAAGARVFVDDLIREDEQRAVDRWLEELPIAVVDRPDCEKGCAVLVPAPTSPADASAAP